MSPFLLNALLAGLGVAVMSGMLGCFVAWRRMAYFGDAMGHVALLGVALALILDVGITVGVIVVCSSLAWLLARIERNRTLGLDSYLGILAHGALALGLVLIAWRGAPIDLGALLFGDILTVSRQDLGFIYAACALVVVLIARNFRALMQLIVHEDIAQIEGVRTRPLTLMLMLLMALVVAVSIKTVGILLVTSLLIIPAAAARQFVRTPLVMMVGAVIAGLFAVTLGLSASLHWDVPTGPAIILAAIGLLAATLPMNAAIKYSSKRR